MKTREKDLTEREADVLELLVEGYSNKDIAEKLYITHHTVKAHLTQVYKKLGVKNRSKAIVKVNNNESILHQDSKRP